ncbi:hypothetical protein I553_7327 [Mycobacterium xenopi 4042]|uniref:Uncharacterized protein n=1 Tax=Mycobacterium xenopi 4042 TaxID=1299334 RepID=X8E6X6_MYCXE|nr:hypothetical protein I553_7327 [Mycobacterium xenopi 4042]
MNVLKHPAQKIANDEHACARERFGCRRNHQAGADYAARGNVADHHVDVTGIADYRGFSFAVQAVVCEDRCYGVEAISA